MTSSNNPAPPDAPKPRLLEQVRNCCRVRHMALKTEYTYVGWIRRFILFHGKRHPLEMGDKEVTEFLTHLAVAGHVAASTQNQALSALLFLYRTVLQREFGWLNDVVRAKKPKRLPVVFSPEEAMGVLGQLEGVRWLMGMLLYGAGLRLEECLRLRVKDPDFERLQITVRDAKGEKDRLTLLPGVIVDAMKEHLVRVRQQHERALRDGYGGVELPYALERKYPQADREWGWQYVFPAVFVRVTVPIGIMVRRYSSESKSRCQLDQRTIGFARCSSSTRRAPRAIRMRSSSSYAKRAAW